MSKIRREVLNIFKKLHRTRQQVFRDDTLALCEGRRQINENFRKNQHEADADEVKKMLQLAVEVEAELRTNVMQAVEKDPGVYELRISEQTTLLDNKCFDPADLSRVRGGPCGGCDCGFGEAQAAATKPLNDQQARK